jgi:hypothetical protein
MSNAPSNAPSTRTARLQLGLVSALCIIGLGAAVRPYGGFSNGDTVKVPGLGFRTPVELALLALRTASGLFALWLICSIVASLISLVRARNNSTSSPSTRASTRSNSTDQSARPIRNSTPKTHEPRLFGPGWLQQLLRQAAGGTLALALLAGPASAVTRSPQVGTARTVLAPVASVLANDRATAAASLDATSAPVQFAGDVTTGQRWPVLPFVDPKRDAVANNTSSTNSDIGTNADARANVKASANANANATERIQTETTAAATNSSAAQTSPPTSKGPGAASSTPISTQPTNASPPKFTNATTPVSNVTSLTSTPRPNQDPTVTSSPATGAPTTLSAPMTSGTTTVAGSPASSTPGTSTPGTSTPGTSTPGSDTQAKTTAGPSTPDSSTQGSSRPHQAPIATSEPSVGANTIPSARTTPDAASSLTSPSQTTISSPTTGPIQANVEPPKPSTQPRQTIHIVQPGESFWSIAELHILANNSSADDHEIARYWELLQAQNASRLPAPGIPDLLFPGTELELPRIP